MMIKWLYNKYKSDFIKLYQEECRPKGDFSQMEYRFTDSNGKKYYGYSDKMAMSFDRFGALNEFYIWWSNGLSENSLNDLLDIADKALETGIIRMEAGKRVNAIKIGAVLNELRTRKDMVRHVELVYNIIACQLIREDEDLFSYSAKIQLEKVEHFKKEVENNNAFFLHMKEYKQLFNSAIMSPEEFLKYAQDSEVIQKEILERLQALQ